MIRSSRRAEQWLYTAILLLITGWLAVHWPHQSLWYDEALTTWVATGPWERLINWCTQVDIQVPLHYIVLRGWTGLLGNSEFALHLLSALCGLLAVSGLMALTRRLIGARTVPTAPVVAGLLLGLSAGFLWVAYEVRAYALALALYAWASVLLYDLLTAARPRRWVFVAYSLLMLGVLYTHYTGIGALAAHIAIVGWTAYTRRSVQILRRMAVAGLIMVVGFAPWLPILLSRGSADRSYYAGSILPDQTLGVILSFKWLSRDDFRWLMPDKTISPLTPLVAGGMLLLITGIAAWLAAHRHTNILPIIYGLCIALLPGLMIAAVVYFKPKLAGRYDWPSWIGLDLLIAAGIVSLAQLGRGSRVRPLPVLVTVALIAVPWLSGQIGHPPNSDFRGAFAYIREHWQPGDLLVLRDGTLFPVADYYHSPLKPLRIPDNVELTDATHVLHAQEVAPVLSEQGDLYHGVWVMSWQGDVMDPEQVIPGLLETMSDHRPASAMFGDVGLDYFALNRPLSSLRAPQLSGKPLMVMPDGLALDSARLVNDPLLAPGGSLVGQTWWWRPGPVNSDARVSIRLYGSDGQLLGQIDQPPAGWVYFPDRWPDNTLILGRYEMQIPANVSGPVTMKLRIYSAADMAHSTEVTVGTAEVRAAAASAIASK